MAGKPPCRSTANRDRCDGQSLFTLHAQSLGALQYALGFVRSQLPIVHIDAEPSP